MPLFNSVVPSPLSHTVLLRTMGAMRWRRLAEASHWGLSTVSGMALQQFGDRDSSNPANVQEPLALPPFQGDFVDANAVLARLRSMANPINVEGMARFGIKTTNTLGISLWDLRKVAKDIGTDHSLALDLWDSGVREARMLAAFVDDPLRVTEAQMDARVRDFDSWDVCDTVTTDLFYRTPLALTKAI